MLHLTSCRNADARAADCELREIARKLERGMGDYRGQKYRPMVIREGSREASICVEALRRVAG